MYRIAYLWLISFLLVSCTQSPKGPSSLPYYNESTFSPLFMTNEAEIARLVTHQIADFSFWNQDSILVSQEIIEGKIHVANFIFTSCGSICPKMTSNLKVVSDSLSSDSNLVFLSYSVTPWIDHPHVLKKYIEDHGIANDQWYFLTGSKAEIYDLARKSYFAEEDIGFSKDSTEFLHTEHFVLVDQNKRIRGIYNGTLAFEMQQLIEDIRTLEKEVAN